MLTKYFYILVLKFTLYIIGKNDKLVETVLKGISKDIHEKGIVTEKALRDRFETVIIINYFTLILMIN